MLQITLAYLICQEIFQWFSESRPDLKENFPTAISSGSWLQTLKNKMAVDLMLQLVVDFENSHRNGSSCGSTAFAPSCNDDNYLLLEMKMLRESQAIAFCV